MHTSELGVRRSMICVLATFCGVNVASDSNHVPAPTPMMNAAAIMALVVLERPPLPSLPPGVGGRGGVVGGGVYCSSYGR